MQISLSYQDIQCYLLNIDKCICRFQAYHSSVDLYLERFFWNLKLDAKFENVNLLLISVKYDMIFESKI